MNCQKDGYSYPKALVNWVYEELFGDKFCNELAAFK